MCQRVNRVWLQWIFSPRLPHHFSSPVSAVWNITPSPANLLPFSPFFSAFQPGYRERARARASEHTEQLIKWSWKLWRKGSWFIIFQVKQISDFYFYFFFQMGIGSRQASNAFGLLIMLLRAPMRNVCCVQKAFLFIDVQNRSIRVRLYRFMNIAIILVIHRGYNTIYSLFISFYTYSIKFTMSHGERGRCSGIERQS